MSPARLWSIVAMSSAAVASAQTSERAEEEFSADRPGFATSTGVLRSGVAQIEGGVTYSVDRDGGDRNRTLTFGSPLLRVGIWRSLELRVGGDGVLARSTDGGRHYRFAGWSDLSIGAKYELVREGRFLPAISVMPALSVPSGCREFTSFTYDPSLAAIWLKTLPAGLSVGGTVTHTRISDAGVRHSQYEHAVSVGVPAPAQMAGYVEVYTVSSWGEPSATWISDAGFSRNFGANLQIDIEAGRRISSGSACWFVATGFAFRRILPFKREGNGANPSGTRQSIAAAVRRSYR